jgi:hypothetical protein
MTAVRRAIQGIGGRTLRRICGRNGGGVRKAVRASLTNGEIATARSLARGSPHFADNRNVRWYPETQMLVDLGIEPMPFSDRQKGPLYLAQDCGTKPYLDAAVSS